MVAKTNKKATAARLVDPEDFLSEEDFEFEDFLEELGPEISTVSIFRVLRDGAREQLDKVPLSELLNDVYGWLREQCGPGKYQLYFRGADRRYRGAKTVLVGERKAATNGATATAGNGNHQEWMEKQFSMQQAMITGMLAAMKGPDIGSLLQGVAALAPKPPSLPDPSAMLTAVATVFATLRGPQKDEDWLTRAKTIIELAKDLQPEHNGGDNAWSVVRDVGKEVLNRLGPTDKAALPATTTTNTPIIREHITAGASSPAAGNIAAADVALSTEIVSPVVSPADTTKPNGNGAGMQLPQNAGEWLRFALAYLKQKAQLFKDPGIYIENILDNEEEPQWAAVVQAMRQGATFDTLIEFDAEIGTNDGFRNWFQRLYDGLHSELFPSMDTRGARGNEDHAGDHARASVAG